MAYMEELRMKIEGIWNSPNQFSETPNGSLLRAINVNLDTESILSTRRGMVQFGDVVSVSSAIKSIFSFQSRLLPWTEDGTLRYDSTGNGTWVAYADTFDVPDATLPGARVRSFEQNKNFYFTSSNGVYKLDLITNQPIKSGAPPGLGGTGVTTGISGWFDDDKAVAYRIVWGYTDANDYLILGAASDRIVCVNDSGGTRNTIITFTIPSGWDIDANWFYQVYRSDQSATAADPPSDVYQQVFQGNPTGGELASRSISYTDIVPDALRRQFLYSSYGQQGALEANYPPPFCTDMCEYKNYAFYANTREPHFFEVTLLSVGPTAGIQVDDTITFTSGSDTFTITGKASENAAAGQFLVETGGSVEQNNEATARSIVNVINLYASNTFLDAYYTSNFDDLQGQLNFTKRTIDSQNFYMNSSRTTCWSAPISASGSTSTNTSVNNVFPNRVYISKLQQPEAVPLTNFFDVGSKSYPILRIKTQNDAVIIFKGDGIYAIVNDTLPFRLTTIDNTAIVVAPNSVDSLNNAVYYASRQGMCRINADGTPEVLSEAIENDIKLLQSYDNFAELTFGLGYESDRKYICGTVMTPSDEWDTVEYIYNYKTRAWTTWDRVATAGIVQPSNNTLYFSGPVTAIGSWIYQERKTITNQDFADEEYEVEIVSSAGLEITLTDASLVEVDMSIVQGEVSGIVESVDYDTNVITVDELEAWEAGEATVFTPIYTLVKSNQFSAGNPGVIKRTPEISLFFKAPNFNQIDVTFFCDYNANSEANVIQPTLDGQWGMFPWGTIPWGGVTSESQRLRCPVPKGQQRNNWLVIQLETNQCFVSFELEGFAVMSNQVSQRQKK